MLHLEQERDIIHTSSNEYSARVTRASIFLAAAAALVLTAACDRFGPPTRVTVPPDSAAGEIGFRLSPRASAIIVPAFVNGRGPVDLILDTGSTLTCLDDSLADELALPRRLGAVGVGAAIGMTGPVKLLRVDSLRIGATLATNITVCALDLRALQHVSPGARGLLGLNFLKSFRVGIDFRRRVIQLGTP